MPPSLPTIPARMTNRMYRYKRVHETYPASPTLVNGRPNKTTWVPTVVREEGPGYYYQIIVNGTDFTFFRNLPSKVLSFEKEVPFDDARARLWFPQITHWEQLGEGALADFIDGDNDEERSNVDIWLIDADDVQHGRFEGFFAGFSWRDSDGTLEVDCVGALHQNDLYVRAPGVINAEFDIGELIANQWNLTNRPHLRTQEMVEEVTGLTSRYKGGWEPPTEYIRKLLAIGVDPADGLQWTVMMDEGRLPVLKKKKAVTGSVDYTVTLGARGVTFSPQRELMNSPNVYYGEGEQGGITWRRAFRDSVLGLYYQPIAWDPEMHLYEEDAGGNIVDAGVPLNLDRIRVESHLDFGAGFSPGAAAVIAEQIRLRDQEPGYVGTLSLDGVSPEEAFSHMMEPDTVLKIKQLFGTGATGVKFYVSKVAVDVSSGRVALTLDTQARDLDLIQAIRERKDVRAKNPVASLLVGRESGVNLDSKWPWDREKSGWLPDSTTFGHRSINAAARFSVAGETWLVQGMQTAERADIFRFEVHMDQDVAFHVSVYDRLPDILPTNPMEAPTGTPATGPWTPPLPDGFLVGFGQYQQRAGYYPYLEYENGVPTGATPTGDFVDEAGFQINHDLSDEDVVGSPNLNYVAIWVDSPGAGPFTGWARMSPGRFTTA